MKEAIDGGELRKHDVGNFAMYDSRRSVNVSGVSSVRRSSSYGVERSMNNLREFPNDRSQDVNAYGNFNDRYKRDRFMHEYPVYSTTARAGDHRMDYLFHSTRNERDTGICGTGDGACRLI
jgi:hypothetical protein